jgi:hypothetical protein
MFHFRMVRYFSRLAKFKQVLRRPSELAGVTGKVGYRTKVNTVLPEAVVKALEATPKLTANHFFFLEWGGQPRNHRGQLAQATGEAV